jgi:competence protein ComEC
MNQFGQYPFVRILMPFLSGILTQIYLGIDSSFVLFLFCFLFVIYFTDYITVNIFGRFSFRLFNGIYLFVLLFSVGICWVDFFDDRNKTNHYIHLEQKERVYQVEIINDPVKKERSLKTEVRLKGYFEEDNFISMQGNALLYFRKNESSDHIQYGDELLVQCDLKEIPSPQNPDEFNYKQYCSFHRIYAQGFVNEFSWKKVGEGGNSVFRFAIDSRKKLLAILSSAGLENQEYAVASALILGYTNEIDQETKTAYSSSGALHVLSVSGLHVAIIFAVFDKLLLILLRLKNGKYYKAILILLILWIYALLTGLSPSVMRSAAMLSFVVIGKLINRNASIYNILSASAFVLLCFDPLMIMEVGFQLSYLAVLGIVYLHPKIYHLFYFPNRIIDFVWNVTAVSVAAQIATFPLSLLYFHQFPNYFLISNLIVIPLGTVILYNGILALIFAFIPGISDFLIFTLKWSVKILNESVYWVEQLPYSLSTGISISIFETWLIYILILSFLFFTVFKKSWLLKLSMTSCILLFTLFSFEKWNQNQYSSFVVYHIKNELAMDMIEGRKNIFISSSTLKSDENKMLFHVLHHWDNRGIIETNYLSPNENLKSNQFFKYKNCYSIKNLRVAVVDTSLKVFTPKERLKVNILVLSQNPKVKLEQIRSMYDYEILVIDLTNKFYRIENWKKERLKGERIYVVGESGAFVKET